MENPALYKTDWRGQLQTSQLPLPLLRWKRILKIFCHSAIYLLIAGT